MANSRHPNVVNQADVPEHEMKRGRHHMKNRRLGTAAGSRGLGATLTEVAPGCVSFPRHYHCANEEGLYFLSGSGAVRIGEERVPVRAGDWVALPPGPEYAHQVVNDGVVPLVFLCVSTMQPVDVVGYPDSRKIGAWAGNGRDAPWQRVLLRETPPLDYWDGEPEA